MATEYTTCVHAMEILHTKHELTPGNAEALTKWLKNGSEVMWKGIFPPSITYIYLRTWACTHQKLTCGQMNAGHAVIYRRCHEYLEGQMYKEVHDDINLEEDPKVIAKREKVEAIWKDIDDARQCGKSRGEIIATDRRGIDKIAAPKLNGHIRKLEAYLHTTYEPETTISRLNTRKRTHGMYKTLHNRTKTSERLISHK
jgi:hypothetical protein